MISGRSRWRFYKFICRVYQFRAANLAIPQAKLSWQYRRKGYRATKNCIFREIAYPENNYESLSPTGVVLLKLSYCIVLLISLLMLASCKIRIIVPEGGSVTTQSGAYRCAAGKTCNIDVVDFYFDQTFVAKPANGYTFKFWKKADRRFCGQDTRPCQLTTVGTNGNKDLAKVMMSFFESNEVFYLQPVFEIAGTGGFDIAKYEKSCKVCHATGENRAPKTFDATAWAPRLAKGIDQLLVSVKDGFRGMPPKGMCFDCTDADYIALIQYMSAPAK